MEWPLQICLVEVGLVEEERLALKNCMAEIQWDKLFPAWRCSDEKCLLLIICLLFSWCRSPGKKRVTATDTRLYQRCLKIQFSKAIKVAQVSEPHQHISG